MIVDNELAMSVCFSAAYVALVILGIINVVANLIYDRKKNKKTK